MRALRVLAESEDLSGVAVATIADAGDPAPGQVLVRVRAAALNFPDYLMTRGGYQLRPSPPFTLGMELAGEIIALGADPRGSASGRGGASGTLAIGQGVMGSGWQGGALAEMALVRADSLSPVPEGWSWTQAAAFSVAMQTAWVALARRGGLRAGERVLVLGAGGGVGLAMTELARALGARTMAITSPAKAALVRARGAEEVFAERTGFRDAVLAWSQEGVDVVADNVGGDAFDEAVRCLAPEGRVLSVGFASGRRPTLRVNYALIKEISLIGVRAGSLHRRNPVAAREDRRALEAMARSGLLMPPHIDAVGSLAEAPALLARMGRGEAAGKLVIDLDSI